MACGTVDTGVIADAKLVARAVALQLRTRVVALKRYRRFAPEHLVSGIEVNAPGSMAPLNRYNHISSHHALGMRAPVPETILEKPQISGPVAGG